MDLLQKILETDTNLFLFLNGINSDYWDTIMILITSKEVWIPFYIAILFFTFKRYRGKALLILIFLGITILLSDQLSVLIKETVQRLRPVHDPRIQHLVHNVFRKGGLYSFVSSHATNTFGVFFFAYPVFRKKSFTLLLLFWAIIVSYSRIYLGVHYPLDIIGGVALGAIIGILIYKIMMFIEIHFFLSREPKIEKTGLSTKQAGMIFLIFCVLWSTVFIVVTFFHTYNII